MGKRQRCKEGRIHNRVNGRGGADSQGQRDDNGHGQARILAQHSHAIAKILEQTLHGASSLRTFEIQLSEVKQSIFPSKRAAALGPQVAIIRVRHGELVE